MCKLVVFFLLFFFTNMENKTYVCFFSNLKTYKEIITLLFLSFSVTLFLSRLDCDDSNLCAIVNLLIYMTINEWDKTEKDYIKMVNP